MAHKTSIKGHVAVIAAGADGIGLACAELLAAEGAKVAVIDRDAAGGKRAAGRLTAAGAETIAGEAAVRRTWTPQ
ncbi:MAG: SDR family NAD(P)-dependent oxidoreductase [Alphaproteobacteria bacterium]|nr:SDR family NAD(P)-dependent oxidoreductase [Alphaproteobacteria bacterium]